MKKTITLLAIIYTTILVFSWLNSLSCGFMLLGFGISILFISPVWLFFFVNTTIDFIIHKSFLKLALLLLYCATMTGSFILLWGLMAANMDIGRIIPPPTLTYSGSWSIEASKQDSLFLCEYEYIDYGSKFLNDSAKISINEIFVEKESLSDSTSFYTIIQINNGFKGYNRKWILLDEKNRHLRLREKTDKNGKPLKEYKFFKYDEQTPPDTIRLYIAEWITVDSLPESEKVVGEIIDSIVTAKKKEIIK